ncbi:hypothetical protein M947_11660 [Sulfurimonas hongkongensis]|uniref:Uncharacterized protein n=1 Tax=Sulfurimonas hongkongensis TaxID=1172190 RepID=T0JBT1_9BACT|nr:hypothetical protein [Sulfurimonas hongkongensis]EQB34287.1 hypothetical protein M947_11660 [Sulfurimonas hongkongensis]
MSASKKTIENSNRLRYIRALERFHKSIISYLSNTKELTHEGFNKKIDNASKILKRVQVIDLYKGDLQDLQKLVTKIISYKDTQREMDEIKSEILYSSNQLDKNKNARRYKKDKHINSKYDEWE